MNDIKMYFKDENRVVSFSRKSQLRESLALCGLCIFAIFIGGGGVDGIS